MNKIKFDIMIEGRSLHIELPAGIYLFDPDSGTGKSYLCHLINKYPARFDYKASAYTYKDTFEYGRIDTIVAQNDRLLLILDRCDLYPDDFDWKKLLKLKDSAAVVLDMKTLRPNLPFLPGYAYIKFTGKEIILTDDFSI